ncbi:elongation of very long chain fatty acids protein F-like [Drosophila sulfurigaster albostrigata]|uniref:elongation of very long chain fatty acids protein F-like n=1 Tax=Drosophila sulfurigaster albostrigata TaxID=89887 RepID=UPI002D2188D5|nr:elongation of very long chain fatty acids protein F-like [Drosophila sulfurigaster albostrigata]
MELIYHIVNIFRRPHADPTQLILSSSPWPMLFIICSYLLFVLKLGRKFMDNREAFKLQRVLQIYNFMQVLYNSILLLGAVYYLIIFRPHNLSCLTVMASDNPLKNTDRLLSYAYYINKFIDLLDTVFIVLRKNYKQITALHLLHHLYMPISGYFIIRFNGFGGHIIVTGILNLFVHIIMYSYYYFASQRPNIKRNLWWKQYITILQMVQFVIIFVHCIWTLSQPKCEVSRFLIYMVIFMSVIMFIMFTNFFIHAYVSPKNHTITEKQKKI